MQNGAKPERIQKILSSRGVASRRDAEEMIMAGRVAVNGTVAQLGQSAVAMHDIITVDGQPITPMGELVYIMLNKPRGYVTTMSDERSRKTVMSLAPDLGVRIYPVGRLDINSEGLLLMTNDGAFANAVAHPSHNKLKTYEVSVTGDVTAAIPLLQSPLALDSAVVHAKSVKLKKTSDNGGIFVISISEGRNRQIRRMCELCSLRVLSLKRIAIGSVELGSLKTGGWRHLTQKERDLLNQ